MSKSKELLLVLQTTNEHSLSNITIKNTAANFRCGYSLSFSLWEHFLICTLTCWHRIKSRLLLLHLIHPLTAYKVGCAVSLIYAIVAHTIRDFIIGFFLPFRKLHKMLHILLTENYFPTQSHGWVGFFIPITRRLSFFPRVRHQRLFLSVFRNS